jgi:Transglycosylase SLT domain
MSTIAVIVTPVTIAIQSLMLRAGTAVAFSFYSYRVKVIAARLRQRDRMRIRKSPFATMCAAFLTLVRAGAATGSENSPGPVPLATPNADQAQDGTPPHPPQIDPGRILDATQAKKNYQALIRSESEKNGLPPDIAEAVTAIESGFDPGAVGAIGEIGLMQVRPETAAMLGFNGDLAELARPDVNIHYGVTYLSQAWRLTGGDLCRTLMKYRAGHGEEVMSARSVIYCGRARAHLAAMGSPLAETVSVPFVFEPPVQAKAPRMMARRGPPKYRTAAVSHAFWAAEEARVKAITKRIEAKWRQMAAR